VNPRGARATLIVTGIGTFLVSLDLTILTIAIPTIGRALDAPVASLIWMTNAYVLALVSLLLLSGRLGDLFGQRRLLVLGLSLFILASGLCASSGTYGQLIAFRGLQGVGAALLLPQTIAIISKVVPEDRRTAYLGILGAVAGAAGVSALTAGAALIAAFGWRSIFIVNVPIGLIGIAITLIHIPRIKPISPPQIDIVGAVLISLTLVSFTYILMQGPPNHWRFFDQRIGLNITLPLAVVFGLSAVSWETLCQTSSPLIELKGLRSPSFWVMSIVAFSVSVALIGITVPLSLYLQAGTSRSPLSTGLLLLPLSVLSILFSPLSGRLADRFGGRPILVIGLGGYALSTGVLAGMLASRQSTYWLLLPLVLLGLSNSSIYAPVNAIALASVDTNYIGMASGVLNTLRQLGFVAGGALVAGLLPVIVQHSTALELTHATSSLPVSQRPAAISSIPISSQSGNFVSLSSTDTHQLDVNLPENWQDGTAQQAVVVRINRRSLQLLLPIAGIASTFAALIIGVNFKRQTLKR